MPEDGLFSNLKFTDVLFPAAATIASAYNPYISRGLNTGMNLFNTFSSFQNNLRYWKDVERRNEELEAAKKKGLEAIDTYTAPIREKISFLENAQNLRPNGEPLLDESQTSHYTLFGEGGPELPDPKNREQATQHLGLGDIGADAPQDYDLAIEAMTNPNFANMDIEQYAASDEERQQLAALQDQLRFYELQQGLMDVAPGVAAQQTGLGSYQQLQSGYRNRAREADMKAVLAEQDNAQRQALLMQEVKRRNLERELELRRRNREAEQAKQMEYLERQGELSGAGGKMTFPQSERAYRYVVAQFDRSESPDVSDNARKNARDAAVKYAIMLQENGFPYPEVMDPYIQEYKDTVAMQQQQEEEAKAIRDQQQQQKELIDTRNKKQEDLVPAGATANANRFLGKLGVSLPEETEE